MMNWTNERLLIIFISFGAFTKVLGYEDGTGMRCKFQEYRCSDGSACLKTEKLCNGVKDCPSGEDESYDCRKIHLNEECGDQLKFFRCRFGGCVPRMEVCNGITDCKGGSDEASDLCGNSGLKPAPNQIPTGSNGPKPKPQQRPRLPPTTTPRPPRKPNPTTTPSLRPRPAKPPSRPVRPPAQPDSEEEDPVAVPPASVPPAFTSRVSMCPGVEDEEGVKIKCALGKKEVNCTGPVTNGTIATYECKKFYSVTQNSPKNTRRMCKLGSWTKRNLKWNCVAQCGVGGASAAQFVVGGRTSEAGKWPWHVGFYHQDPPNSGKWVYYCGGTVISSRSVLTAAHCVLGKDGQLKMNIRLLFGKFYRSIEKKEPLVQERRPIEIKHSQYYNSQTFASDIATVLIDPLEITDRVKLVCLPNDPNNDEGLQAGDVGTVVGWGRYADNRYPEELQEANLPVKTTKECQKTHPSLETLVNKESFCAGYRNGTSPCDGDSGGGFVYLDPNNKWSIYGVVSAGVAKRGGGCDARFYTVFTKVVKFRDFIDSSLDQV